tara:strand:- start:370 stop:618 length:249 start_codon:yes stop_codon:yes gene_type:complete
MGCSCGVLAVAARDPDASSDAVLDCIGVGAAFLNLAFLPEFKKDCARADVVAGLTLPDDMNCMPAIAAMGSKDESNFICFSY